VRRERVERVEAVATAFASAKRAVMALMPKKRSP
jgi:hypothetical protein